MADLVKDYSLEIQVYFHPKNSASHIEICYRWNIKMMNWRYSDSYDQSQLV